MQFQISNLTTQYDHLKDSESKVHSKQQPYTADTLKIFSRIVSDFHAAAKEEKITLGYEDFRILNKIMQTDLVSAKIYDSTQTAKEVLSFFLQK